MKLRELKDNDCNLMLEWMHDEDVVKDMKANFKDKTLADCLEFVKNSFSEKNKHLAIVNEEDEYMGTVSLKNIDKKSDSAEFAITIRRCAMGKGYSSYAMRTIIENAFAEYGLENVYWYVNKENARAVRFYDKMGYTRFSVEEIRKMNIKVEENETDKVYWYCVRKNDLLKTSGEEKV